jgi:hypothetical protein
MSARKPADAELIALVERTDAKGKAATRYVCIGTLKRTEGGDYVGELELEPTDWKFGPERRVMVRLRKD